MCGDCNKGLADFRDDPALLLRAADYVMGFRATTTVNDVVSSVAFAGSDAQKDMRKLLRPNGFPPTPEPLGAALPSPDPAPRQCPNRLPFGPENRS